MSYVNVLASPKPMPLRDCRTWRTLGLGEEASITGEFGFAVEPYTWNPYEMSHCKTEPFQYHLELAEDTQTLADLRAYLEENLLPGERVQLWGIWLGDADWPMRQNRFRGKLADFDQETFHELFGNEECCITIER